ncbi:hypothetical protein HPB50_000987 [Hyalomma asiaticum]|uniref:Uncharacterized protein n=1 Tax=Hyalomma asiaticum TaxID=266040 RepID=A0ACB7T0U9_HYAAI|nr:hypothetical protein HPB50_000987 [Hyalomma asiaticum]
MKTIAICALVGTLSLSLQDGSAVAQDVSFYRTYAKHPKAFMVATSTEGLQKACVQLRTAVGAGEVHDGKKPYYRIRYNYDGKRGERPVTVTMVENDKGVLTNFYKDFYMFKDDPNDEMYNECERSLNNQNPPVRRRYDGCDDSFETIQSIIRYSRMHGPYY